jgi:hypothetical protein
MSETTKQIDDGGRAFAGEEIRYRYGDPATLTPEGRRDNRYTVINPGMTLRDYFAANAIRAVYANADEGTGVNVLANEAYAVADAMIHRAQSGSILMHGTGEQVQQVRR